MKYKVSETNISKNIEWRTQIYQYSKKQNTVFARVKVDPVYKSTRHFGDKK